MTIIKLLLVIIGGIIFLHQVVARIVRRFWHFPAPSFIHHVLDSRFRRRMQPPEKLIEWSGIGPGMTVLDLGCGSGAFTIPIARAVGRSGKVYALDIQPAMLDLLSRKLSRLANEDINENGRGTLRQAQDKEGAPPTASLRPQCRPANVALILASAHDLPFADSSLDVVCITTVLYEIPDRRKALREMKRVLRPGGYLAISELFMDPDYRVKSTTIKEGQQAGFVLEEAFGRLWAYTMRFVKPT